MDKSYHAYQLPLFPPDIDHVTSDCVCAGKKCSQCDWALCLGKFQYGYHSRDGYAAACKACAKAIRDTEEFKAKRRKRDRKNAEHVNKKRRDAYASNPEPHRNRARKWREEHPEIAQSCLRKYNRSDKAKAKIRRWLDRNIKKRRSIEKAWRQKNPEKEKLYKQAVAAKRRARKMQTGGSFTAKEWKTLKEEYNNTCLRCRKKAPEVKISADHIRPLSKGGSSYIDNIQPLCTRCNSIKGTRIIDYRPYWKDEGLSG